MSDKWDGIPERADKTGLHYITDAVALWEADKKRWFLLARTKPASPEWLAGQEWAIYRGPCPKPPEAADG